MRAAAKGCRKPEEVSALPVADPIQLVSAARAYKGLSHQNAAWHQLQERLRTSDPGALAEFAELFRADPPAKEPSPTPGRTSNPLAGFPFFAQQDNGPEGWRQCQTSSIAMCLRYLRVKGVNDDLDYLRLLDGDTTRQEVHRRALAKLGVRARFRQNLTTGDVMAEIKVGLPVAIGVLHHGPVSRPSGGGHYIAVYGFDSTHWIVNDPFGELDLVNGGWSSQVSTAGKGQRYSFRNLNPRFMPQGGDGWGWVFS